jgi:4-alpha-glucanotransferase
MPATSSVAGELTAVIREGLAAAGIDRLIFAIHDQSFPSAPDEDFGRGSPYGRGARSLLTFVEKLGFTGVQLGPQGATTLIDPSPYDGALLSKSPLSIALGTLGEQPGWQEIDPGFWQDLLQPMVAARPAGDPDRVSYQYAWHAAADALAALHQHFRSGGARHATLAARFAAFQRGHGPNLQADAEFEALTVAHGTDDWRHWPGIATGSVDQCLYSPPSGSADAAAHRRSALQTQYGSVIDRHFFGQFILHEQHQALRRQAGPLSLYGDLQIGFSHRDLWSRRALFRDDYLMGAPPSRTNPDGQPWGYPVLDPEHYVVPPPAAPDQGSVLDFLTTRVDRMLADFDGIRIDHPHGLVCPWVYAAGDPDPARAVSRGARLRCSPHLADHPRLDALAIPTPAQLSHDPGIARYADDWVRALDEPQIVQYGVLFDAVMARVAAAGRKQGDVICEVLSTWPFPLRAVMRRYGLGRFCVTQKADLTRADDVYRSENASAADWIMVGNHDTRPIWLVADAWHGTAAGAERAAHLAQRLMPRPALRARLARWLAADGRHLCQAMFAELFASRARSVSVFFADLFGAREVYNRPGIVDPANWTLRLSARFEELYQTRVRHLGAFNVPLALALALVSSRGDGDAASTAALVRRLIAAARALVPALDGEIVDLLHAALV